MRLSVCVLLSLLLTACTDPREARMRRSFEHAQAALHKAQIEPFSANHLRAAMATSNTPLDFLIVGQPADSDLGPYRWQQVQQPYDVVISGTVDDWLIQGYGESMEKPLESVNVTRESGTN